MTGLAADLTELLFDNSFMTLATADGDGCPWASPVEFVCDAELRFYWTSHVDARHSRNVRANPRAAFSMYDSTQPAGVRAEVQGLYGEGVAEELDEAAAEAVQPSLRQWIALRRREIVQSGSALAEASPRGESPWRHYRLTPTKLYALDPGGHPDLPGIRVWRVPVDLTASFSLAYRSRLG